MLLKELCVGKMNNRIRPSAKVLSCNCEMKHWVRKEEPWPTGIGHVCWLADLAVVANNCQTGWSKLLRYLWVKRKKRFPYRAKTTLTNCTIVLLPLWAPNSRIFQKGEPGEGNASMRIEYFVRDTRNEVYPHILKVRLCCPNHRTCQLKVLSTHYIYHRVVTKLGLFADYFSQDLGGFF